MKLTMIALTLVLTVVDRRDDYRPVGSRGEVTLSWTMPTNNMDGTSLTNLAGAKVYVGTASSNYTRAVDAGMVERFVLVGLQEGQTYYCNGTAYNRAGLESDFCTEVIKRAEAPHRWPYEKETPPKRLWIGAP